MSSAYRNITTICACCEGTINKQRIRTGDGNSETWESVYVSDCQECAKKRAQEKYEDSRRSASRQEHVYNDEYDDTPVSPRRRSSGNSSCGCILFTLAMLTFTMCFAMSIISLFFIMILQ